MKRKISLLITITMLICVVIPAQVSSAATIITAPSYDVKVMVNGKYVDFSGGYGQPFISTEGRTLVPLRGTAEAYGCTVTWDPVKREAKISYGGHYVIVPIGSPFLTTDFRTIVMDTFARIIDDRTYLPIRFPMEAIGATVNWDENTRTVIIENPNTYKDPVRILKNCILNNYSELSRTTRIYSGVIPNSNGLPYQINYDVSNDSLVVVLLTNLSKLPFNSYCSSLFTDRIPYYKDNNGYTYIVLNIDNLDKEGSCSFGINTSAIKEYPNGVDIYMDCSFNKGNYGRYFSYKIINTSFNDFYSYNYDLMQLLMTEIDMAVHSIDNYCNIYNLGISSADFGFSK